MPNFYHKFVNLLIDLKNIFYECFNDCSFDYHVIRAQNVLLWPICRREGVLSINCTINCTLLKAMPNVQHFLNFVNLSLVRVLLDKAVSK